MTAPTAATVDLAGQLAVLAADLEDLGLATRPLSGQRRPCLKVTNPNAKQLSEVIYAARSRDGQAWFWWSWRERIDSITSTQAVAATIARVLAVADHATADR